MKIKRFATPRPLLNWVLRRGRDILAFQVAQVGKRYEVSVCSPGVRTRLYGEACQGGATALQLHASLVAGFRDKGWTSTTYR